MVISAALLFAANVSAQPGFGPEAGLGVAYMHFVPRMPYVTSTRSPVFSGRIGGTADLALHKHIYFQPGLFASLKGDSRSYSFYYTDSTNETIHDKVALGYLDAPINIVYKTGVQGAGRFFFGVGVTFSYLITGSINRGYQGRINGVAENYSQAWHINDSDFRRFDVGVSVTTGYELPNGLYFRAYFISGSNNAGTSGEVDKNRIAGAGAGYFFGKRRSTIKKEDDDLIAKPEDVR